MSFTQLSTSQPAPVYGFANFGYPAVTVAEPSAAGPLAHRLDGLRVVVKLADNTEIVGIPERAAILDFDDVVDLGHALQRHVRAAVGDRASTAVTGDHLLAETAPAGGRVAAVTGLGMGGASWEIGVGRKREKLALGSWRG